MDIVSRGGYLSETWGLLLVFASGLSGMSWLDEGAETRDPARLIGLNIPGRRGLVFIFPSRPSPSLPLCRKLGYCAGGTMKPCFVPRVGPCDMYLGTRILLITGR